MGSTEPDIREVDVLLVGAGFGTFAMVNKLRKIGLKYTILEKGSRSGGVWYWNCYPGARVDSETPFYQLFDKELWEDFTFKERYPNGKQIRQYFDYVDKKWNISQDIEYDKNVEAAVFHKDRNQWLVETSCGEKIYCRWFILSIGFAARRYTPNFEGFDKFKGEIYHTAVWPQHDVRMKGKKVAQIGTGATGIQVAQTVGPVVDHLTVFQRTPNYTLPMHQRSLDNDEEQQKKKDGTYEETFKKLRTTFSGFPFTFQEKNTFDDTPEEREKFYASLIEIGGFRFWLNNYNDMLKDLKANDEAYKFWRKTVIKRISDPKKQELLAPQKAPHPWGTKRPSLEQNIYEVLDLPHVDIIDVNEDPIVSFTEKGIKTKNRIVEVDVIILATGFDSSTGGLTQLNICGTNGQTIADHWKNGCRTSVGISMSEFPNMFFLYGPQAPTAFSNGPSCTQFQAEWLVSTLKGLTEEGITYFEAKEEAQDEWCRRMREEWDNTLFPLAKSWYQGANIPGKKVEPLNWVGGTPEYVWALEASCKNGYQGWIAKK